MKYIVSSFLCLCQMLTFAQTPSYLKDADYSRVHYYKIASGYVEPSADNGIILTPKQTNTLLSLLDNKETHTGTRMRCFTPHDEFIFYNANNEEVGHLMVSFECNAMLAEPQIPAMQGNKNAGLSKNGEAKLKNLVAEISKAIPTQKPKPVETLTYTVKKGETLNDLAKKFSTSVAMIQTLNPTTFTKTDLTSETLQIKKNTHSLQYPAIKTQKTNLLPEETVNVSVAELRIKATKTGNASQTRELTTTTSATAKPTPALPTLHIVQKGDTLYSIARNHGTSVENLLKINNLNSANIGVGQKLKLKS